MALAGQPVIDSTSRIGALFKIVVIQAHAQLGYQDTFYLVVGNARHVDVQQAALGQMSLGKDFHQGGNEFGCYLEMPLLPYA